MIVTPVLTGARELQAELNRIPRAVDVATVVGMRAAQRKVISAVRKNMNGAPRWTHRGKGFYPSSVTVGTQRHQPRGGGIGKLTGDLRRGVGGKRTLVSVAGTVTGGVGVGGGKRLPQNNLKKRYDARYPFFTPGVRSVQDDLPDVYAAAWKKAVERKGL